MLQEYLSSVSILLAWVYANKMFALTRTLRERTTDLQKRDAPVEFYPNLRVKFITPSTGEP